MATLYAASSVWLTLLRIDLALGSYLDSCEITG